MSVHSFVGHFLKSNGYTQTLKSFEAEHGSVIPTELPHGELLEEILADRGNFLTLAKSPQALEDNVNEELKVIKNTFKPWSAPYPSASRELGAPKALVVDCAFYRENGSTYGLLATTAKTLVVLDVDSGNIHTEITNPINGVVCKRIVVASELVLLCGMDGKVYLGRLEENLAKFKVLSTTQVHLRLITDVTVTNWRGQSVLVSMGWDKLVKVHTIHSEKLEQIGVLELSHLGTSLDAVEHRGNLAIVVCKNEITLMDVLSLERNQPLKLHCKIALSDAEFLTTGFTPMCVRIFAQDLSQPVVAVATSHEPFMRVIVTALTDTENPESILRGHILANFSTPSPQSKFSHARLEWRFDGSGLWLFGDDGVIRGFEVSTGRTVTELKVHDGVIKSLCVDKDRLLTCGSDRKIKYSE